MCVVSVDQKEVKVVGLSQNISRTGILFRSSAMFSIGQEIEYLVDLYPDCALRLRCRGRVVRWQNGYSRADGLSVTAATLEEYECVQSTE